MASRIAVITGGTSGIGLATARFLAPEVSHLIILGRSEGRGREAVHEVSEIAPACQVEFQQVDLSSLPDVRRLSQHIREHSSRIDILINNAGTRIDRFAASTEGHELTFATNHLGPFLFTLLLKDPLTKAPLSRVITISSGAHRSAQRASPWLFDRQSYDRRQAYAKSKLANILFAFELSRRWANDGIISNAVEPGNVATRFARNNGLTPWLKHRIAHTLDRSLISATEAAEPIADLALNPKYEGVTGKYFRLGQEAEPSDLARDPGLAKELWDLSLELTKLSVDRRSEMASGSERRS